MRAARDGAAAPAPLPSALPVPPGLESVNAVDFRAAVDAVCAELQAADAIAAAREAAGDGASEADVAAAAARSFRRPPKPPTPAAVAAAALPPPLVASLRAHGHYHFPSYERNHRFMLMEVVDEWRPPLAMLVCADRRVVVHTGRPAHKPEEVLEVERADAELAAEAERIAAAERAALSAAAATAAGSGTTVAGVKRRRDHEVPADLAALAREAVVVKPLFPVRDKRSIEQVQSELKRRRVAGGGADGAGAVAGAGTAAGPGSR